jgi:hypothetical protein
MYLLSTDHKTKPARKAIYAHAQDFVKKDELLLCILNAFAQCTSSLHATRNA